MKKIIMLVSFVSAAFISQAAVNPKVATPGDGLSDYFSTSMFSEVKTILDADSPDQSTNQACTVTLKGTVNTGIFSIEVSCSSTSATCEQATKTAASCLSAAIRTTKEILL